MLKVALDNDTFTTTCQVINIIPLIKSNAEIIR